MRVYSICQKLCIDKVSYKPSINIGDGADGEVFEIADDNSKVIKFGINYTAYNQQHFPLDKVMNYLINNPSSTNVKVFDYKNLGCFDNDFENPVILYYYVMEKLNKISQDERKVFHSIVSHEDSGINKNYSLPKIKEILRGLAVGLDFDAERIIFFCENFRKTGVYHNDIHVRNIMKDDVGNFKLIDFDRARLGDYNV